MTAPPDAERFGNMSDPDVTRELNARLADDDAEDLAGEHSRPRYTAWAGGIVALALVALALWGGAHLSVLVPGMRPAWLAGIVGVCLAWLVVAVLGWCAAELLKTHHRAMRAAAWRGTRRGGAWAWRTGRHHGGRAVVWAGGRWQQRTGGGGPPSMFRRLLAVFGGGDDGDGGEPCPSCAAGPGEPCEDGCAWRTEPCPMCHAPAGQACAAGCSGGRPGDGPGLAAALAGALAAPPAPAPAPAPAPEPEPAGDLSGRTVYMTRVRLAAGGTETPQ